MNAKYSCMEVKICMAVKWSVHRSLVVVVKHLVWYRSQLQFSVCFLPCIRQEVLTWIFPRESALFLLILSALFISAPGQSSTYDLQSASQCHSRFFQCRLRHTPSALSPPPCTPCHLKRERVMSTVPGFDTVVWVILKESSVIEWCHQREPQQGVWNLLCSALIKCSVFWALSSEQEGGMCNQTGKGKKGGTIK